MDTNSTMFIVCLVFGTGWFIVEYIKAIYNAH